MVRDLKRAFMFVLLLISSSAFAVSQTPPRPLENCKAEAPYGFPMVKKQNTTKICRFAYVLEHDNVAKIPAWVSYVLHPKDALSCAKRKDAFAEDQSLKPDERASLKDYTKSGYDRGHMANSADMLYSRIVQRESFLMSNMAPQLPGFNRGIWKALEGQVRGWGVARGNPLLVYMGPIYDYKQDKRIGNGVIVPSAFFKIVIDTKTREVQAFIFRHEVNSGDTADHLTSVAEVQRQAGILLPLPAKAILSKAQWDLESSRGAKQEACSLE